MSASKRQASGLTSGQCAASYEKKSAILKKFVVDDPYLKNDLSNFTSNSIFKRITVFISICNRKNRATVFNASAYTLNDAWNLASEKTRKFVHENNYRASWVKADIICNAEFVNYENFKQNLSGVREYFYKKGVAFDTGFESALLSEQLNTTGILNYNKKILSLPRLRDYFNDNNVKCFTVIPKDIILFSCTGYVIDETKATHKLYPDDENYGRRIVRRLDKEAVGWLIRTSSEFLSEMVLEDGKFNYGINPVNNHFFTSYNILRHSGTIWSLVMQYNTTKNADLIPKIKSTINYMLNEIEYMNDDTAFLVERKSNEIKIGGNAVVIIALTTYMEVFESDEYVELLTKLGNGILTMQETDGSFFHVLNFPDYSRKEQYRIVYYDGEAAFALSKMYGLTKDKKYLDGAEKAVNYFIRNNYIKYRDHWIAYSINEITKYIPSDEFFSFGLKNANENLTRIYEQDTSYHTYLELLMVTFELYERIIENNITVSYMSKFEFGNFIKTIFRRAHHMLNGYLYPEIAMYMESPETVVNTFCVRHDSFRIRIDDVQHFIGGYYGFYNNIEKLEKYYCQVCGTNFDEPSETVEEE